MRGAIETSLLDPVLEAMTSGMVSPEGDPYDITVERRDQLGHASVSYRRHGLQYAKREVRVDSRRRVVSFQAVELDRRLERNGFDGTALHEQFVANLGGTACVLQAIVSGPWQPRWTRFFDWAPAMSGANAAAVRAAVEKITPHPGDPVWGGADLPDRVKLIGGPDPALDGAGGSWRRLVETTTPAALYAALEEAHHSLGTVVFSHVSAWYGERVLS